MYFCRWPDGSRLLARLSVSLAQAAKVPVSSMRSSLASTPSAHSKDGVFPLLVRVSMSRTRITNSFVGPVAPSSHPRCSRSFNSQRQTCSGIDTPPFFSGLTFPHPSLDFHSSLSALPVSLSGCMTRHVNTAHLLATTESIENLMSTGFPQGKHEV